MHFTRVVCRSCCIHFFSIWSLLLLRPHAQNCWTMFALVGLLHSMRTKNRHFFLQFYFLCFQNLSSCSGIFAPPILPASLPACYLQFLLTERICSARLFAYCITIFSLVAFGLSEKCTYNNNHCRRRTKFEMENCFYYKIAQNCTLFHMSICVWGR